MTQNKFLSRRRLLLSLLAGVAGLRILSPKRVLSRALSRAIHENSRESILRNLLADLTPFHAIGQAYLAQAPGEANVEQLRRALFGADLPMHKDALQVQIAQAEHDDFVTGRIVSLNGWLLSRTSVRVSALAVLTANGTPA